MTFGVTPATTSPRIRAALNGRSFEGMAALSYLFGWWTFVRMEDTTAYWFAVFARRASVLVRCSSLGVVATRGGCVRRVAIALFHNPRSNDGGQ